MQNRFLLLISGKISDDYDKTNACDSRIRPIVVIPVDKAVIFSGTTKKLMRRSSQFKKILHFGQCQDIIADPTFERDCSIASSLLLTAAENTRVVSDHYGGSRHNTCRSTA